MGVYVSPHKYTNMKSIFIQQFLGSSLLSPAYGCGGTRATKNMIVRPPKKIWAKPKQAGKKEGVGGKEFLPACSARRRRAGSGKAFPQFLRQQEGKTEKFSFP